MIDGILATAAPLLLASLGALLTELTGTLGVFIEGFMILGSFFSWVAAGTTGSVALGLLYGAVLGGLIGWALARFVRLTEANPFIVGLALNVGALGTVDTLSSLWYGTKGVVRIPSIPTVDSRVFVVIALGALLLEALIIDRTPLGLRLRSVGGSPEAAFERGIRIQWYREGAWTAAAVLASLAGAALSFRVGAYAPGGVAGRGWIALAAVYLGFRRVWGVAFAALLFAFVERIGSLVQGSSGIPATLLLGLPSALALVLFTLSSALRGRVWKFPPSSRDPKKPIHK
jgi:simple sugar transport system permease protein